MAVRIRVEVGESGNGRFPLREIGWRLGGGGGGTIGSLYAGRANLVRLRCMGQWVRADTRARPAPLVALPGPGRVPHQTRPLLYYSPTPATPCLTLQCILLTNRLPQSVPMTAIITFITSQPTRSLGIVHGSSGGSGRSTPHPTLCWPGPTHFPLPTSRPPPAYFLCNQVCCHPHRAARARRAAPCWGAAIIQSGGTPSSSLSLEAAGFSPGENWRATISFHTSGPGHHITCQWPFLLPTEQLAAQNAPAARQHKSHSRDNGPPLSP